MRTLETFEEKTKAHNERAQMHKLSLTQKFAKDCERIFYQGAKHKEEQERIELEKASELLEKMTKRKKALEKYEKAKNRARQQ